MTTPPPPCGCVMDSVTEEIKYCPLHAAASRLRDALENAAECFPLGEQVQALLTSCREKGK